MYRWRPTWELRAAFKAGQAVVHHKIKERQGCVGPCTADADELYAVIQGDLQFFDGRRWQPAPPRALNWFPRRKVYGIRPAPGYAGGVRVVSILFMARNGFAPGLPRGGVRLSAPWWRRFLDLETGATFDPRGLRVLGARDLEAFIEQLARAVAPKRAAARKGGTPVSEPRRPDTEAEWLEVWTRAEDVIGARAGEGLTVDELAAAVHVSPTQLRRVFHAARGCSPKAALTAWRIEAARRLLRAGKLSITQVAARAGFGNLPRFSAAFKAAVGCTPTEFARRPR